MGILSHTTTIGYGFLFCAVVYAAGGLIFQYLLKGYATLPIGDKRRWNLSFVRSAFAFVGAYIGFRVLLWENELISNVAHGTSEFSELAAAFTIGFFVWENVTLYWLYFVHDYVDMGLFVHHALGLFCFSAVLISGSLHFLLLTGLIEELSAPFTAFGWVLSKLRKDGSRTWIINQIMLVVVWITCRMFIDAILVYHVIVHWVHLLTVHWIVLSLVLFGLVILACFLNPYWFYMKAGRLIQVLRGQQVPLSPISPARGRKLDFPASPKTANDSAKNLASVKKRTNPTPPASPTLPNNNNNNNNNNNKLQNGHSKDPALPGSPSLKQNGNGIHSFGANGNGNQQKNPKRV